MTLKMIALPILLKLLYGTLVLSEYLFKSSIKILVLDRVVILISILPYL